MLLFHAFLNDLSDLTETSVHIFADNNILSLFVESILQSEQNSLCKKAKLLHTGF